MRSTLIIIAIAIGWPSLYGQPAVTDSATQAQQTLEWYSNLYDYGILATEDSILITPEVTEILANEKLQKILYPEEYTWEVTVALLQKMELKKAFWFFINLYPDHEQLVLESVLHYDKAFEVDHMLLAAYYTYAFADPAVCSIEDGKPVVKRPDLVEEKLYVVKEMVAKVSEYRMLVEAGND